MDFQHARLHQRDQAVEVVDGDDMIAIGFAHEMQIFWVHAGARMFLKEAVGGRAFRQRTRASGRPITCGAIQSQTLT